MYPLDIGSIVVRTGGPVRGIVCVFLYFTFRQAATSTTPSSAPYQGFMWFLAVIRPILWTNGVQGVAGSHPVGSAIHGRFQSRVLSVVLSIEPGRSRHRRVAKAANRAIHLGFTGILP